MGVLFFKPLEEGSTTNILFPKSWWGIKFHRRCICSGWNQKILRGVVCQGASLEYVDDSLFRSSVADLGVIYFNGFCSIVHAVYLRWRIPVSSSPFMGICSLQNQLAEGRRDCKKYEPRMISRVARRKPRHLNLETLSSLIVWLSILSHQWGIGFPSTFWLIHMVNW